MNREIIARKIGELIIPETCIENPYREAYVEGFNWAIMDCVNDIQCDRFSLSGVLEINEARTYEYRVDMEAYETVSCNESCSSDYNDHKELVRHLELKMKMYQGRMEACEKLMPYLDILATVESE